MLRMIIWSIGAQAVSLFHWRHDLFQVQPHQDIVVMIAKAPAENIDAAGMRGVFVDTDPQTNRVMFG
jgi:hypothetical protein